MTLRINDYDEKSLNNYKIVTVFVIKEGVNVNQKTRIGKDKDNEI